MVNAVLLLPLVAVVSLVPPPARCPAPDSAGLLVRFLSVGQGDAAVSTTPDGRTIMVDGAPTWSALHRALRQGGGGVPASVDLLVLSHNHQDHIGGVPTLLRRVAVRNVVENGLPSATATYGQLLTTLQQAGPRLLAPTRRTLTVGTTTVALLPPLPNATTQNLASVGALLSYGRFSVLFAGDAEPRQLAWWLRQRYVPRVTVVKVPHHGSRNGTTAAFARATRPAVAVISAGRNNRYRHPHPEGVARWQAVGATVMQTTLAGTIAVRGCSDGTYRVARR
jgi:competence protein ComEC